jgi:hypothetical protein
MLESEQQAAFEPVSTTEPAVETPNPELVVARESQSQTFSEGLAETPPEPIKIPSEAAQTEPQPVRKQDWL